MYDNNAVIACWFRPDADNPKRRKPWQGEKEIDGRGPVKMA